MSSNIARAVFLSAFLAALLLGTAGKSTAEEDASDGLLLRLERDTGSMSNESPLVPGPPPAAAVGAGNATTNKTMSSEEERRRKEKEQLETIVRAGIVLGTITTVVVIYVAVRYVRQQRQLNKSKKYGLITMPEDDTLEMRPLDDDEGEEDEDTTVFERSTPNPPPPGGGGRARRTDRPPAPAGQRALLNKK